MGIVRMGPPFNEILEIKKSIKIDTFIETGTYYAQTAIKALQYFKTVYTIELSKTVFEKNKKYFNQYLNIKFLYGNSKEKLKKIINELKDKSIFWLDAHWSGGETYGALDECPILNELEIILKSNKLHIVFIDDARMFMAPPPKPHNIKMWPSMRQIDLELSKYDYNYFIYEDVIIAFHDNDWELMTKIYQNKTTRDSEQNPGQQVKLGVNLIKNGVYQLLKRKKK